MAGISITQLLTLYTWFLLVFLLGFFLLLARFYQKFASEPTFFQLFALAIVLLGGGLVRYAGQNSIAGDSLGDLFLGIGGILLGLVSLLLYYLMTRNR